MAFAPGQAQCLKSVSLSGPSRRQSATTKLASPKTVIDTPKKRSIALILSPIGLLLISAGRLIIVSNYNTTTAVTIAASGGYVSTLLGSMIPLVAIFAPYMALILLLLKRFLLSIMLFVFAAFITPSPLSLRDAARIASLDWRHMGQFVSHFLSHVSGSSAPSSLEPVIALAVLVLSLAVIGPLWIHHRELAEVAGMIVIVIVAAVLLLPTSSVRLSIPVSLRLASEADNQREHQFVTLTTAYWPIAIAIGLSIIFLTRLYSTFPKLLSATVAIVATFALFPYVSAFYPIPQQHGSYYSEVLHELWLPAEKIVLAKGQIYYGYILSGDTVWDTVLLTNRKILYLHDQDIVQRSVCQPPSTPEPAPYTPLIPLLYTKPAPTPPCGG